MTGPVYGHEPVGPLDHDLTRQHKGEPLGERIIGFGWEVIRGQTLRPGNADYPVAPDFGPLRLDHLLEPYPYLPGLQRRMYEGVEDEGV
jgi:hypothetical protein